MGFAGSGKNTAAQCLISEYHFIPLAFADSLKDACAAIFSWDRELLEGDTDESRVWREQIDKWWANKLNIPHFTPRFALQHIGTDVMRNHFNSDIWLLNVEKKIHELDGRFAVITDSRFTNEASLIRKLGGNIYRIKRGEDPVWMNVAISANNGNEAAKQQLADLNIHPSEYGWVGTQVDACFENTGDVEYLWSQIRSEIDPMLIDGSSTEN